MHVVVNKKELLRVLARCQGVADKKSTMPVLGNVALSTKGDRLRLAATDLYLAVSGEVAADVDKPGSVAVGARDLFERVKMMPEGQVSISVGDGSQTTLRSVGSARRYILHGIPGEEFPTLPEPEEGAQKLDLDVTTLARLIGATHFAISTDETRLHLNSALFEWEGAKIRMVSTDGHRLAKLEVASGGRDANASMLIPLKGVSELRRLCDEALSESSSGDPPRLALTQSGPNAFFDLAGFHFSVKLVDAQFPPYQQVIPENTDHQIRLPRDAVMDALRAVRLAANDRTGGVKISLSKNAVRFTSESPESGEGFDEVAVDYQGPDVTIGFNAGYFIDVLNAIDSEEVVVELSGELDPALIRPGKEADGEYVAVIMPMRI